MKDKETKTVVLTLRVRPSTKEALRRLTHTLDRSQAGVIEQLVREKDALWNPSAQAKA